MRTLVKKIVIASLLAGLTFGAIASEAQFCAGFERGYIAGYKKATGRSMDPLTPLCPLQPLKRLNDPESDFEHGYLIGLERGLTVGR
jgi:hypothetical protein